MNMLARFFADETGATAIEYGLIAAGISVAIIATVVGLGSKLNTTFTSVNNAPQLKASLSGRAEDGGGALGPLFDLCERSEIGWRGPARNP